MKGRDRKAGIAVGGSVLALAAVLAVSAPAVLASAKGTSTSKPTTTKALRKAGWQSNVAVSFSSGSFRFRSDGVPKQGVLKEYAVPNPGVVVPNETNSHIAPSSEVVKRQFYDFPITTEPRRAKKATSVFTGPVGVTISGALLFNPYEGDGETVAMASNFTLTNAAGEEVPFLDPCNGHPSPGPVYAYHYHGLPPCVTELVDKKNGPSHIIGVAFDGFPIYGDRDIHGRKIKAGQLDKCNGIKKSPTPEFPHGIYHYVVLDIPAAKSSIDCFRGVGGQLAGLDPAGDLDQALVDRRRAAELALLLDDEAVDLLALGAAALHPVLEDGDAGVLQRPAGEDGVQQRRRVALRGSLLDALLAEHRHDLVAERERGVERLGAGGVHRLAHPRDRERLDQRQPEDRRGDHLGGVGDQLHPLGGADVLGDVDGSRVAERLRRLLLAAAGGGVEGADVEPGAGAGVWRSTTPGSNMLPAISITAPRVRSGPSTAAISSSVIPFWTPTARPSGASSGLISSQDQRVS